MSNRTFFWLFVWMAATFGWFVRIVHVEFGQTYGLFMAMIGGALLIAWLERRMAR